VAEQNTQPPPVEGLNAKTGGASTATAGSSTAAKLWNEYLALKAKCEATAIAIKKREPELAKKVQEELLKIGLNLTDQIAKKRAAWTAWEKARDAELAANPTNPPAASPATAVPAAE